MGRLGTDIVGRCVGHYFDSAGIHGADASNVETPPQGVHVETVQIRAAVAWSAVLKCSCGCASGLGDESGGWIYIDGNDSRLRSERMHHGTRQKQVHANNNTTVNKYVARTRRIISQMET